jgi:chemotaxis protein histidine kinase CheA
MRSYTVSAADQRTTDEFRAEVADKAAQRRRLAQGKAAQAARAASREASQQRAEREAIKARIVDQSLALAGELLETRAQLAKMRRDLERMRAEAIRAGEAAHKAAQRG